MRDPVRCRHKEPPHERQRQQHNDDHYQPSDPRRPGSPALQHVQDVRGISLRPPSYGQVSIGQPAAVNNGYLISARTSLTGLTDHGHGIARPNQMPVPRVSNGVRAEPDADTRGRPRDDNVGGPGRCAHAYELNRLAAADPSMVKVSVLAARRLARLAAAPMTRAARQAGCAWSRWRRRHQARARWHHYHARLKAADQAP